MTLAAVAVITAVTVPAAADDAQPRFTDNDDGTVTDHHTELTWLSHPGALGELSWSDAIAATESLAADGLEGLDDGSAAGDWRLPTYHELISFTARGIVGGPLPDGHPFVNMPTSRDAAFWTASEGAYDPQNAWSIRPHTSRRNVHSFRDKSLAKHVWAVRGEIQGLPEHKGPLPLDADIDSLTERELERAELNALWDFRHLRTRDEFVVRHTDEFLNVPPDLAESYPSDRFSVAEHAPTVKLRILPNLEPQYFPEGEAYSAGWANWAKVTRSDDNRFFMAASDHRGRGAKINIYAYEPEGDSLERVLDVAELLGWHDDMYTDGKIHGYMGLMPDGTLWAATHRGPRPTDEWWEAGYRGAWLLSYNIQTGEAKNWGNPLVGQELPYHTLDPETGRFVASGGLTNTVLCWDVNEQRVRYAGYPPNGWIWYQVANMPDRGTGVFWGMEMSEEPYRFMSFDTELNRFEVHDLEIPRNPVTGNQGRFTHFTPDTDADGWHYCVTTAGTLFRFRPRGADGASGPEVEVLGVTSGETGGGSPVHQLELCPERRFVYYVPRRREAMVVKQYDIETGEHKALGFLTEPFLRDYGYSASRGTYGMNVSNDGSFLVIFENGAFAGRGSGFGGHPAVLVVEIPEEERRTD